jgi:universal stress protein E
MQNIRSILVVIDRSADEHPELERALTLAKAFGAKVHVYAREYNEALYVHYVVSRKGDKLSKEAYEREAQWWINKQLEKFTAEGIEATGEAAWQKHLFNAVMEKIRELEPDLVIKGTRRDTRLHRTLFNYTDWELMRHCTSPLLLVKQPGPLRDGAILCAVNPGHSHAEHYLLDEEIMSAGKLLADKLDKSLHAFNTFEIPPEPLRAPSGMDVVIFEDYRHQAEEEHRDLFDDFVSEYKLTPEQVHSMTGAPEEVLPSLAEKLPASIVVMGVVSRSALPTMIIGHTAENTLDRLECDVLVLKHPEVHD